MEAQCRPERVPTVSYQVGDLARLPVPKHSSCPLRDLVDRAIAMARVDSKEDETTYDFVEPSAWRGGIERVTARHRDLGALENEIDEEVYRLYEISPEDRKSIEEELAAAPVVENENAGDEVDTVEEASEAEASVTLEELAQHRLPRLSLIEPGRRFQLPTPCAGAGQLAG